MQASGSLPFDFSNEDKPSRRMVMKSRRLQLVPKLVLVLSLFSGIVARAQITPSADAYTNTASPTTNYGAKMPSPTRTVEAEKSPDDRGHYLYPDLVGAPETARIGYVAPAPGSVQIVRPRPTLQKRGNASPLHQTTPILPIPPMPGAPKIAPRAHPVAQAGKPELNQR
jgi:hypothetical protein